MVAEANTTYLNQNQWYADSGANILVTSDLANLRILSLTLPIAWTPQVLRILYFFPPSSPPFNFFPVSSSNTAYLIKPP